METLYSAIKLKENAEKALKKEPSNETLQQEYKNAIQRVANAENAYEAAAYAEYRESDGGRRRSHRKSHRKSYHKRKTHHKRKSHRRKTHRRK
jgi:7,8-dihydro-6-hydroxymethylpterin-pyrophosphokinase